MSTDLHERTTNPPPEPREPEKPKPALSIAQVAGGALAAMTAAALGSRLSVAGTVVGAALASVVAAVAGSIYTASLRRTHDRVSAAWKGRRPVAPSPAAAADPATDVPIPTGRAADVTQVDGTPVEEAPDPGAATEPRRGRIGWKPVLVGALLMFAIAAVALTGIELATGQALSGGSGTTVGQVADGGSTTASKPTQQATATPTPTASASSEPTATPSADPSGTPSSTPSPSGSAEPSTSASPTPEVTPGVTEPAPSSAPTS